MIFCIKLYLWFLYLEIWLIFIKFVIVNMNILQYNVHQYAPNLLSIFVAMLEALFLKRVDKRARKSEYWRFSSNFGYYIFCNDKIQLLKPARGAAFSSIKKISAISSFLFLFSDIYGVILRRSLNSQWSSIVLRHSYIRFFHGIRKVCVQMSFPLKALNPALESRAIWICKFSFLCT